MTEENLVSPKDLLDREITIWGDTWTVIGVGTVYGGKVYCHLESKTRVLLTQKNGRQVMRQSCDWIELDKFDPVGNPTSIDG